MREYSRQVILLAVTAVTFLNPNWRTEAAVSKPDEAITMMSGLDAQEREANAARVKDAAWRPTCKEVALIQVAEARNPAALKNFCLNTEGNILACYSGAVKVADPNYASGIRVYSPKGELLKVLQLDIAPEAICVGKDGIIFAAGAGRLLKLDESGKVIASVDSPVAKLPVVINKETEDMVKETIQRTGQPYKAELARMKTNLERRRSNVTGLAVTDQDVFMAVPSPTDFTFRVYRFNHDLAEPKLVVEKLRGCCGQMDIQSYAGNLWIPHNARHAVESHDRDGKELARFGKAGRVKASDFGGCCEPKNIRVLNDGDILAAESGPPTCIKRFSADGKFKEVVALVNGSKGDCVRATVERSPDGRKYYMLDAPRGAIRVFSTGS